MYDHTKESTLLQRVQWRIWMKKRAKKLRKRRQFILWWRLGLARAHTDFIINTSKANGQCWVRMRWLHSQEEWSEIIAEWVFDWIASHIRVFFFSFFKIWLLFWNVNCCCLHAETNLLSFFYFICCLSRCKLAKRFTFLLVKSYVNELIDEIASLHMLCMCVSAHKMRYWEIFHFNYLC